MSKRVAVLLFGDMIIFIGAGLLAVTLRWQGLDGMRYFYNHLLSFVSIWIIYAIAFYTADLYNYRKDFRAVEQVLMILITVAMAFFIVTFLFYVFVELKIGRGVVLLTAIITAFSIMIWRNIYTEVVEGNVSRIRIVIVGAGRQGCELHRRIKASMDHIFEVVGFIDDDPAKISKVMEGVPILGGTEQLEDLIERYQIEEVVLATEEEMSELVMGQVIKHRLLGKKAVRSSDFYADHFGKVPLYCIDLKWLYFNTQRACPPYYYTLKRIEDLILAGVGLVLFSPLMFVAAILIKLDSRGPVFYRQTRLGLRGERFTLVKFRSMVADAEKDVPVWSSEEDPRITRVGRVLRKSRIDEIPQLINVLKGEMSIVGPRPEREYFVQQFLGKPTETEKQPVGVHAEGEKNAAAQLQTKVKHSTSAYRFNELGSSDGVPFYASRLFVKPGVTGWAQVNYGYVNSLEGTREKLEYDLYYLLNRSLLLDSRIILQTVKVVLMGKGT